MQSVNHSLNCTNRALSFTECLKPDLIKYAVTEPGSSNFIYDHIDRNIGFQPKLLEYTEILKRGFPLNWLDMTRLSGKRFQYCFSKRKATLNYVHKDTNSIIAFPKYTVYIKQLLMLPQVLVVN